MRNYWVSVLSRWIQRGEGWERETANATQESVLMKPSLTYRRGDEGSRDPLNVTTDLSKVTSDILRSCTHRPPVLLSSWHELHVWTKSKPGFQ